MSACPSFGYMVSFDVYSTELTPEEMTAVLGIEPTSVRRIGDRAPLGRVVRFNYWSVELDLEETGLQEQIDALLAFLKPLRERILEVIELGAEAYVRCGCI